ncbi:MIT domain-containing protein 1 [Hyalella azteca]|uniref:MIT domain-containing protein 1 n=1 Tax=Hyalella azteca TaxID=294128 RepID=A0A8B7NB59_HYAAZ|nr:MIT domain-containing protein 1 [Hyalella azteca]
MSKSSNTVPVPDIEPSAAQVLCRAVQLDQEKKYSEAVTCYEQGIRLLLQAAKGVHDAKKRDHYKKKIEEYLARAENLKQLNADAKKLQKHTRIEIGEGDKGYSYGTLLLPYLDSNLTSVTVEDPYIRTTSQLYNLQRFSEALIAGAPNFRSLHLVTSCGGQSTSGQAEVQKKGLQEISEALALHNVSFTYCFSESLHDRDIKLDNGWTIQIGRGLDYFQRLDRNRFSIGSGDYNLRPCRQTTVDIFHTSALR